MQWWRAVTRCQTRKVQEDLVMPQLECQSLESLSPSSSSSLSLSLLQLELHPVFPLLLGATTHTTEHAIHTVHTSALATTVRDLEVAATAITTDQQQETSCSSQLWRNRVSLSSLHRHLTTD